jgi:tetratricopeptide (TPR) repeat protein
MRRKCFAVGPYAIGRWDEHGVKIKTAGGPYPGARPFLDADHDRFFGRAADAAVVTEWWENNRLTYVTGPAGRGKTSLLQAGVLALLGTEKRRVLPVGRLSYGAAFPAAGLPDHNPYTLALLGSWAPAELTPRLAGLSLREFIAGRAGDGIVFAAIDHADELLAETSQRQAHRRAFLGELRESLELEPRLHLLIVGRREAMEIVADALGHGATYDVPALSRQDAVNAISRPLIGTKRALADEAAETLVTDLQTSRIAGRFGDERYVTSDYVEPALLQIACSWLWDCLPPGLSLVSARDVRRYGDVDVALATRCGQIIAQVADDHNLPAKRLASWLLDTFVTEIGTRGKAYEGATTTAGMPNAVARALVDHHLLTSGPQSGSRWYELFHDRLIEPLQHAPHVRAAAVEPTEYLRAAEHALTLGQLDLAERYAREILRTAPRPALRLDAQAYSLLGNLAWEREKSKKAEACYREAARRYAATGDTKALAFQIAAIAQTLIAQGHVSEAIEELHGAVVRQPNEPILQTEFAQALWQDNKGTAAVAILNDVLRMDGANLTALRARGEILAYLGQAREAMRDLERVSPRGQPSISAARGLALARLGDKLAARREVQSALDNGPRNGLVLLYAAQVFALGGDDVAAQELAELAATATDPPLSPPHREAARQLAYRR